jgi:hypothetical protein
MTPRDQVESVTAAVLKAVRRLPGRTTVEITERLDGMAETDTVSWILQRMAKIGAVENRSPNRGRSLWFPSETLKRHGPEAFVRRNVKGQVLALVRLGITDVPDIVRRVGVDAEVVRSALSRLGRDGHIFFDKSVRPAAVYAYDPRLDDDGWTPPPYVTAIRARALGIAPATQRTTPPSSLPPSSRAA